MGMIRAIAAGLGSALRIMRIPDPARRRPLLMSHLRIQFNLLFVYGLLGRRKTHERMLGFDVHFANYVQFATVFDEIFTTQVYQFTPMRADPYIIDCGANIGMSVLYFKWMYPNARILAFEPDPATFELLTRNVATNRLEGVELHCAAIGGAAGEVPFHYREGYAGWLTQSTAMRVDANSQTRMVPMVTLSSQIAETVDMLKVDIEGAEGPAFDELESSGKLDKVREMALEYHHHMQSKDDQLASFLGVLERNGFGYMISASYRTPFVSGELQGIMIGAYRRDGEGALPAF